MLYAIGMGLLMFFICLIVFYLIWEIYFFFKKKFDFKKEISTPLASLGELKIKESELLEDRDKTLEAIRQRHSSIDQGRLININAELQQVRHGQSQAGWKIKLIKKKYSVK